MTTLSSKLRPRPASFSYDVALVQPSDRLITSDINISMSPRDFYLSRPATSEPGPVLAVSPFVPTALAAHLMTRKRDVAIGKKFLESRPNFITNMEGALHTFVTAILPIKLHGDTAFRAGHTILELPTKSGKQQYWPALLSRQIHLDFETREVGAAIYALEEEVVVGEPFEPFELLEDSRKMYPAERKGYDNKLRRLAILHLSRDGRLPRARDTTPISEKDTLRIVESDLRDPNFNPDLLRNKFLISSSGALSLEMLEQSYLASLVNELSAFETICPSGYIYLYNPPSIFARFFPAVLSTRLMALALRRIAADNELPGLHTFAIDTFRDPASLGIIKLALSGKQRVKVLSREELFSDAGHLRCEAGLTLVVHNNSDAFGQNIETEG